MKHSIPCPDSFNRNIIDRPAFVKELQESLQMNALDIIEIIERFEHGDTKRHET